MSLGFGHEHVNCNPVVNCQLGVFYLHNSDRVFLVLDEVDGREASKHIAALEAKGYSLVCVVVGEKLVGVLAFDDPLRPDALATLARLREMGIGRLALITGDEARVAQEIGSELGLTEIYGDVFPDQKVALIRRMQAEGRTVAMVGDGINDGPALSGADVGVSVANAADLSQETADVLLLRPGLAGLVDALTVSRDAAARAGRMFRQVVGWNTLLLGLGLVGRLTPTRSALLHNLGTGLSLVARSESPHRAGKMNRSFQRINQSYVEDVKSTQMV